MSNENKTLSKEAANKLLSEKLQIAKNAIDEATKIANEHGLTFETPIDHYSMGGTYIGKGNSDWSGSSTSEGHWYSSTESCT